MKTDITEIKNRLGDALQSFEDARDELRDLQYDTERLLERQSVLDCVLEDLQGEIRNLTAELEEHES